VGKKLLITLLKYALGLGLLAWVIYRERSGLAKALSGPIQVGPFLLAGLILACCVFLTYVRWYVLVRAQELPFTLYNAARLGMGGYFFNTFLPGSVGGDIVKATFIAREQNRRTVAVATVLLDRAVGLCSLFWLAAILGSCFWATGTLEAMAETDLAAAGLETIVIGTVSIMVGSIVFWILLGILPSRRAEIFAGRLSRIPKIGHSLAEFWRAVWMYRCRGRYVALAIALAMTSHAGFVLTYYLAVQTFIPASELPSLAAHYLIIPVGMTIQAGVPTPGGVGAAEWGFGELYELLGYPADFGVLCSLSRRSLDWILGLAAYIAFLKMKPHLPSLPEEEIRGDALNSACHSPLPSPSHAPAAAHRGLVEENP
jgi:glycosyltransferase 2 family protein